MATSLYRKYRPQSFKAVSGQRHVVTTLQHQLEMDRVAHAYLFSGPRGTGKTTTSRILAKAVNCQQRPSGTSEPCNACAACESIAAGNALDVLEIDAASHTGVDHVREHIIGGTRVSPSRLKWKVFIIDEVHMLSLAAFNALLKTLEEPPPNVLFVLATTEVGKLPATIVSRCQRFDFKKISAEDMTERLVQLVAREGRHVADGVIAAIVANAEGSVRDAEGLLEQALALGDDPLTLEQAQLVIPYADAQAVLELVVHFADRQATPALELINRLANDGVDLAHFADEVTEWLRRAMLVKSGARAELGGTLTAAQEQQLAGAAEKLTLPAMVGFLSTWLARASEVRHSPLPQLPLELAVVEICLAGGSPPAPAVTPLSVPHVTTPVAPPKPAKAKRGKLAKESEEVAAVPDARPTPKTEPPAVRLEQVVQQWPAVLAQVKTQNYSLFSLLRVMRPVEVLGDTLRIGTAYDFHLERVAEAKNRTIIERTIQQVLGVTLRVEAIVVLNGGKPEYVAEDNALQPLLEGFGGKIVE